MARRKTRKKAWKDFEITKVKLNPEQAVLACCSELYKREGTQPLNCFLATTCTEVVDAAMHT